MKKNPDVKTTKKRGRPKKKPETKVTTHEANVIIEKNFKIQKEVEIPGVDYSRLHGATCPRCQMAPASVTNVQPWENGMRIRYHICRRCGHGPFKSIEMLTDEEKAAVENGQNGDGQMAETL